jgi:Tautomerase enzyme
MANGRLPVPLSQSYQDPIQGQVFATPRGQKYEYASLAAALTSSLDIAPGDVMVVIHTTQSEDWSFGDGLTADVSLDRFGPRHSQS